MPASTLAVSSAAAASHFYADWTFWSSFIAFVALAVSVAPYVVRWLTPARLEVDVFETVALTHKIGNSNAQLHCVLRNVGGRRIKISQFTATVTRDGQHPQRLPARTYLQSANDANALLFTPLSLAPGDAWSHLVNFYRNFDREDDRRYRDLEYALRADISRKLAERPAGEKGLVEGDENHVTPLLEMFERKFEWQPGQYEIEVALQTNPKKATVSQRYRFTLFESDTEELRKLALDYKIGAGVFFPNADRRNWVFPSVTRV